MIRKAALFSSAALAALAFATTPLIADQLTLGGDGQATFTGTGNTTGDVITIVTSGSSGGCPAGDTCIGSNTTGGFESPTGTTIFGGASWSFSVPTSAPLLSLLAPSSPGVYSVDQNGGQIATFNFSGGGGDTVTGTIDWTSLTQSGTTNAATISGTLKVSSVSGLGTDGTAFAKDFPAGDTLGVDYTFNMSSSLSTLLGGTNSLTGTASSGEVPGAPEPTTLVLYGAGMLLVGSYFRTRRHAS
jgi:hypothetical protein